MSEDKELKLEDFKIDIFRVGDVTENASGVRITHKPTGVSVTQTEGVYSDSLKMAFMKVCWKASKELTEKRTRKQTLEEVSSMIIGSIEDWFDDQGIEYGYDTKSTDADRLIKEIKNLMEGI